MEKTSNVIEIDEDNIYQYIAPKHPMYMLEATRLGSYITFPFKGVRTEKFARAGFFYSGRGDSVTCFCCGGALQYVFANDDPWLHHTRNYGNIFLFLQLKKGLHYIDEVVKIFSEMGQRVRNLNKEDMAVASELLCLICCDEERNIIFLPCGHLAVCKSCFFSVKECIICRKQLEQFLVASFDDANSADLGEELKLKEHLVLCKNNHPCRVILPKYLEEGRTPTLKFKNYHHKLPLPIVAYADFECLLTPSDGNAPSLSSSFTITTEKHIPMSYCLYFVTNSTLPEQIREIIPSEPLLYRGLNAAEHFINTLKRILQPLDQSLCKNIKIIFTEEDRKSFESASRCEIYLNPFKTAPIRDHCHLTGKYRSALCRNCNFKRRNQKSIPIFIHNGSNYDFHFIVKELGYDDRRISVIANSIEKYITFDKYITENLSVRFLDSYRFMADSLDALVKNLPLEMFHHIGRFFAKDDLPYVTTKGVYPYEYTTGWRTLDETVLPPIEKFYSKLSGEHISAEEYKRAEEIWQRFNIKTLGEYSDLYLKCDVLLLADVFESFRSLCMREYQLDCAYYYTAPGFAFDAMLLKTKIELDLITDYDKHMFIERGIRGGITTCEKHAVANNAYVKVYKADLLTNYLMYIDANNLYGWAMCKRLPYKDFRWLSDVELMTALEVVLKTEHESERGYILEVDIEYPASLHEEHNDLPFLPENGKPLGSSQPKLLTTLWSKKRYVCHYVNLKQAVARGLVVTKVYRVLQFLQKAWMKSYIELNTANRQLAKNSFEKDFFKLMNNSVIGKCMENVRKRNNIELVSSESRLLKLIAKPTFQDRIIYSENLCAIQMQKTNIKLDKPIYVGLAVLELSKTLMYNFHYDIMRHRYGSNIDLLYMDTDSFFYDIRTHDFYNDIKEDPILNLWFDTSDYPSTHQCYSIVNKKVLGKYKDECNGIPIVEFIGLRAKMYSFRSADIEKKKAKGIKKNVVKNNLTFNDYKRCLEDPNMQLYRDMVMFRSKNHQVDTIICNKLALCNYDDKRAAIDHKNTLAYGHRNMPLELKRLYEKTSSY
ncbi:uncharacterized protein LOC142330379 [Lycorma delicatula]|uniref:uncharacterized protein LOC142330379 n=1 Tax=Lycorma delicatula TaxID=130591 RepID=UPI003F50FA94